MSQAETLLARLAGEALGIDPDDALDMHDRAELLPALLARQILDARGGGTASGPARASNRSAATFARAVFERHGTDRFYAGGLLEWAQDEALAFHRGSVAKAAQALVDGKLTAARLGRALARVAALGDLDGLSVFPDGEIDHARAWRVMRTEDGGG